MLEQISHKNVRLLLLLLLLLFVAKVCGVCTEATEVVVAVAVVRGSVKEVAVVVLLITWAGDLRSSFVEETLVRVDFVELVGDLRHST